MAALWQTGKTLVAGSAILLLLLLASGVTAYRASLSERAQLDRVVTHAVPAIESIQRVRETVSALRHEQQRWLVAAFATDRAGLDASTARLRTLHAQAANAVTMLRPQMATLEGQSLTEAMRLSLADWQLGAGDVERLIATGAVDAARGAVNGTSTMLLTAVDDAALALLDQQHAVLRQITAAAARARTTQSRASLAMAMLLLVGGTGAFVAIRTEAGQLREAARELSGALQHIETSMSTIAGSSNRVATILKVLEDAHPPAPTTLKLAVSRGRVLSMPTLPPNGGGPPQTH